MFFRWAANTILLVHLSFILFVLLGAGLVAKWRWLMLAHVPAVAWAVFIECSGRICPLTYLENTLLQRLGQGGYSEGFIEHYLLKIIYPDGLTQAIQLCFALLVLGVNAGCYGWLWFNGPEHGRRTRHPPP